MITISNQLAKENEKKFSLKRVIFIVGRVHPGETNSSFLTHGIIQFLLSTDRIANYLREAFIFKIVPMINPDGVIVGNNRTSFLGRDLNRNYDNPNVMLTPETYYLKNLIG